MLLLVSGANYFVMFIGWKGIGVVSYLLINYYFTRIQANKAVLFLACVFLALNLFLASKNGK